MVKHTVVLYPSPGIGHLISMVELGKLILKHHPSLSITILITTPPYNTGSTSPYINQVSQTTPSLHFHHLPTITLPSSNAPHHENLAFQLIELNKPLVHQALKTIISQSSSSIKALILDMFCSSTAGIGEELHIPTFHFYTSGISGLAVYLHFPYLMETINSDDPKSFFHAPGRVPIMVSDMPKVISDRGEAYQGFLHSSRTMVKSQGIIVNSFESLESGILKVIREGLSVPDAPTPPIFSLGPLIADHHGSSNGGNECLSWLDSQPSRSVVFLCFGSMGLFSEAQLKDIAIGLENSGQRFLWVVRSPPPSEEEKSKSFLTPTEPDLEALLPTGFLDRTKDRGLVVKSWAPQVDVLSHESVGGFVTHCGWNSVLEAVCVGVPMVAWPLYAEQRINRVFLVEESGIALPLVESENGFVNAGEVEKRVRELMESNEGNVVRERIKEMSEKAKAAMSDGGSSVKDLNEFVIELYRLSDKDANWA